MRDKQDQDEKDMPIGRIVFDERGNAVWQPITAVRSEQTLNRLLKTDSLSVADDGHSHAPKAVQAETGYDPYGSGMVRRGEPRSRNKDLRALSEWMKLRNRVQGGG